MTDELQQDVIVEKSLKQLKEELVTAGMPLEDTEAFVTKKQILAVLNTMKAKEVVKRVDTLDDTSTPTEKKQLENQWKSKATLMRERLMAQPTIRTILPLEAAEQEGVVEWRTDKYGNKYQLVLSGAVETVQLNGFKWIIPKGVPTDVPEQVSEVLDKAYLRTHNAGKNISVDRLDPKTGRPVSEKLQS